jgi:lipopolysaccharide transport system ATP-binding protein
MYYVSHFCRRALWLRGGRVEALGGVDEVVRDYETYLSLKSAESAEAPGAAAPVRSERPARPARITGVRLVDAPGRPAVYRPGDPLTVEVACEALSASEKLHVGVGINRVDGFEVAAFSTHHDRRPPLTGDTEYRLRMTLPSIPLVKGEFTLYVFLLDEPGLHVYDEHVQPSAFRVESERYTFGLVAVDHVWEQPTAEPAVAGARA